jgi:2-polyprenyl-3-methyl-5-hydroxy-6-metoxy-1,4-benzoquinol methylase
MEGPGRAYDAIAAEYDRQNSADAWMRALLWGRYARAFQSGDTVLDLGCGTGSDAIFLASLGVRVHGVDASPEMIAQTRRRASESGLSERITATELDLGKLSALVPAKFDGIISSFAALSTVANDEQLARDAAGLLRPRGRLIIHLVNRTSLWEWLGLAATGNLAAALHLGSRVQRHFVIGGISVQHHMWHADEMYSQVFQPLFALQLATGMAIFRPPANVKWVPAFVTRALQGVDQGVGRYRPFRHWGRFFVLEMTLREPKEWKE